MRRWLIGALIAASLLGGLILTSVCVWMAKADSLLREFGMRRRLSDRKRAWTIFGFTTSGKPQARKQRESFSGNDAGGRGVAFDGGLRLARVCRVCCGSMAGHDQMFCISFRPST